MAKFIFKMQSVLTIKEKLEEQAKGKYGQALEKLHQEEEKLSNIQQRIQDSQEALKQSLFSTLDVLEVKDKEYAVEVLKYKEKEQLICVSMAQKEVDAAKEALNEAMKERKIYEKLKENAFEEFKAELLKEEQKEVDELVSYRFGNGG